MAPDRLPPDASRLTGIPELDDAHEAFITMACRLNQAASQTMTPAERERIIPELLQETISTVTQHFVAEERLMKSYGYRSQDPVRFGDHLEAHADFTAELCRVVCTMEQFNESALHRLGRLLSEFAVIHSEQHDLPFVRHVFANAGD